MAYYNATNTIYIVFSREPIEIYCRCRSRVAAIYREWDTILRTLALFAIYLKKKFETAPNIYRTHKKNTMRRA